MVSGFFFYTTRRSLILGGGFVMAQDKIRKAGGELVKPMTIVPITLLEANDFVEAFHRHNGRTTRNGGKFAIGLEYDSQLVGVAIVGNLTCPPFSDPRGSLVCSRNVHMNGGADEAAIHRRENHPGAEGA
jgi:hypothetical protein